MLQAGRQAGRLASWQAGQQENTSNLPLLAGSLINAELEDCVDDAACRGIPHYGCYARLELPNLFVALSEPVAGRFLRYTVEPQTSHSTQNYYSTEYINALEQALSVIIWQVERVAVKLWI